MKSSLVALSFFFLSFLPNPLLGTPQPLYDIYGDKVVTGTKYYIVSALLGAGGLNISSGRNNQCPLDVIQERGYLRRGSPIILFPTDFTGLIGTVVHESTDLNIKFKVHPPSCNNYSTVWKVDNYDDKEGAWFITTGGVRGNPGPQTLLNWFKFEKVSEPRKSYKIVHCPSVCESCVKLCSDVGLQTGGALALGQSPSPLPFRFIKVSDVQEHSERLNAII